ncbi:lysine-sensitive aspartokinase 3 [Parashewanella spongiae]|uniref:Aspartokinase n=1 Tax=Parashewanella spongiae TaxID=342950 RepID=A0A3A6U4D1_9GAMM|nr:lysine-sensitive aspartokinase 3 [Parashewanella spongiae]MCL1077374.1 lysine-sensitive aspartokinase 3 [Parashewanella spongiae]RJY19000.1 lysine-sensitive aspartokinase 3 [Parashewanella spongiae]
MSIISKKLVIAKFGGTSVADYPSMLNCARIVLSNPFTRLVVVSASSGVTNLLVELTQAHVNDERRVQLLKNIAQIQYSIIDNLPQSQHLLALIDSLLNHMSVLSESLILNRSKEVMDELLSIGEQCSSILFNEVLKQQGEYSQVFDARKVMRTNDQFGAAEPDINDIFRLCQSELLPSLNNTRFVTQGFIGANEQGRTTTLGRGGSDYSAALLAEALNATTLEIWTDVAGIYTTDPRLAANAKPIKEISFSEAAEMATFGAKILHPATILPAVRKNIEVFVGSSKQPESSGTWIRTQVNNAPVYRAVAVRRDQTLLNLHSLKMLHAQGFLAETFASLARHKISVDLITTSEVNVALTLDKTGSDSSGQQLLNDALIQELEHHCNVKIEDSLALVAIIGNNIPNTTGVCQQVFDSLSEFNIRMSSQGASQHNMCILVAEKDAAAVVQTLHRDLFEGLS